jgi:hypothetical protein
MDPEDAFQVTGHHFNVGASEFGIVSSIAAEEE